MHPSLSFLRALLLVLGASALQAQTTPLPEPSARAMELAWMHPAGQAASVPVNKYLEIGFKLRMEHRRMIDNYLQGRAVPDRLNPFDPDDMDVRALFTRIDSTGAPLEREERLGFWYRDYTRDYSNPDPQEWTHKERETDYRFRARFTPQSVGDWSVQVMMIIKKTDTLWTNTTGFVSLPSEAPGFLSIDERKQFFERDGKSFFPVGQNLPWPACHPGTDPVCNTVKCPGRESWCHARVMGPYGFEVFHQEMTALRKSGANYMRFLVAPWNLEIEFETLNNYDERMHAAWETDAILEVADSLGLLLHFNLQVHYPLENPSVYSMYHWDYDDLPCFPYDEPYCYFDELNLPSPRDFLESEAAMRHYKNRLRYMIARYGHATSIGVLELFSEANNIGQGYHINEDCLQDKTKPRKQPYHTEEGYAAAVGRWHTELLRFIREDLGHAQHLLAVNYTGVPEYERGDRSYYAEHLDVATFNHYNLSVDKYFRSSQEVARFQSERRKRNPNNHNPEGIGKPLMFSESGPGAAGIEFCDQDLRFIKTVWLSAFTGLAAAGINWSNDHHPDLWQHLGRLATFMEGVPLETGRFVSVVQERNDRLGELIALKSTRGSNMVLGAVHNRTVNFFTRSSEAESICSEAEEFGEAIIPERLRTAKDLDPETGRKAYRFQQMGSLVNYRVQFIDPYNGKLIEEQELRSSFFGRLNLSPPTLSAEGSPLWVFRIEALRSLP